MLLRDLAPIVALLLLAACPEDPRPPGADDAGFEADGGVADGGAFEVAVLDSEAAGQTPLSIAVAGERIGVAYFAETGGSPSHELRFVEPGSPPQTVAEVDRVYGLSLAFGPDGEPRIAYLGGGDDGSVYWKQSDLALATRSGGVWSSVTLARNGGEAASGFETSDFGVVVGLWPALALTEPGELFVAYRDVHGGQFPTDYQHSDLEVVEGSPGSLRRSVAVLGANTLEGHGGMTSVTLAGGRPALAWSTQPGSQNDTPRGVWFARRGGDGGWGAPEKLAGPSDTRAGPSLSWREGLGFGIAFEDAGSGLLNYLESADGETWAPAEPVHGDGTGGWYPSLAFGPDGEPAIAYYVCSLSAAASECKPEDDALLLKRRRAGMWPARALTVDSGGAWWPRLAWAGARAAIAYKDPGCTVLKLAVQR
jgi:hypothetical protein